jgi:hypothetical protein
VKITIESTTKLVRLNGIDTRVWEGQTDTGIPVHCFVTRITVHRREDASQFERELVECRQPSREIDAAYPRHMVL